MNKMVFRKRQRALWMLAFVALLATSLVVPATPAAAQRGARVDYLVRLLKTSKTFRVRAQAALSLGRVDATPSVIAGLSAALSDEHPAVRVASVASLERLGDPSVLAALKRRERDKDKGVRKAVKRAIRTLKRVKPKSGGGGATPASSGPAKYYVGIGMPGTKASVSRSVLASTRELLTKHVGNVTGVRLAPQNESSRAAKKVLKKKKLAGFYIDTSIVKVDKSGGNTRVVVSVVVNTYPGRDMRAILQGAATVPGATDARAEARAIEGAIRGALRRLPQAMEASRPGY